MTLLSLSPDFPQALMATVAVRATLILAIAWLITRLLRRAAAATRHAVWTVALTSLILLPVVSFVLPRWEMKAAPAQRQRGPMTMSATAEPGAPQIGGAGVAAEPYAAALPVVPSRRSPFFPSVIVVALWILGATFGVGRLSAGWASARRLVKRAVPMAGDARRAVRELCIQLGISRDVRVLMSDALSVPVNCGLLRPVVLLPAAAQEWTAERLRVVLLHELAHVRRWDYASLLVMETARAMYWMNPLVWLAARTANMELERACDDEVLRAGTRSVEYAEHLYEIAASLAGARVPRGALAMAQPSTLRARVGAILAGSMNRKPIGMRALAGASAVALAIGVPVTSLRLLGEGRDAAEVKSEISALTMPGADARVHAALSLGLRQSKRAEPALAQRLADPDPAVRGMAAWALGAIGDHGSRMALEGALKDPESYVREMAVLALGSMKDRDAVLALGALRNDPEMGVRGVLSDALHKIGGDQAGDLLGEMLLHDTNEHVRDMAAWNLQLTAGANAVPWLMKALADSNVTVRTEAARNLAELGPRAESAFGMLAAMSHDDAVPVVRGAASWALGAMNDARATEPLALALHDSVWNVRVAATAALGKTPGTRAIDALISATRDPVHQVRLTAVNSLSNRISH